MFERWKGNYTIETAGVLMVLLGILCIVINVGFIKFDFCVMESHVSAIAMTEQEDEKAILLAADKVTVSKEGDTAVYSFDVRMPWGESVQVKGEKASLKEWNLDRFREWKYIKGMRDEN